MTRGAASPNIPPIDSVFRALSDPTRRHVLERLGLGPSSVSELAEKFDMALPSFVAHLKILEVCGLVRSEKIGRVRTYRLVPNPPHPAEERLARARPPLNRPPRPPRDHPLTT